MNFREMNLAVFQRKCVPHVFFQPRFEPYVAWQRRFGRLPEEVADLDLGIGDRGLDQLLDVLSAQHGVEGREIGRWPAGVKPVQQDRCGEPLRCRRLRPRMGVRP